MDGAGSSSSSINGSNSRSGVQRRKKEYRCSILKIKIKTYDEECLTGQKTDSCVIDCKQEAFLKESQSYFSFGTANQYSDSNGFSL